MDFKISTLQNMPFTLRPYAPFRIAPLPQWHIIACRARWLITPHASDAGADPIGPEESHWLGPAKTMLWIAIAIGTGLLIGNLNG